MALEKIPFVVFSAFPFLTLPLEYWHHPPNLQSPVCNALSVEHEYFGFILRGDAGVVHLYQDVLVISGDWCWQFILKDLGQIP